MKHRPERVQKLIREELGKIIAREVEFEGALSTITEVNVDKHLGTAHIKVSVLPSPAGPKALKALERQAGELQHLLMKKINIKPMPRIQFELDLGPAHAADVERVLIEEEHDNKA